MAARVVAVLAIVWLCFEATGFSRAGDALVSEQFYALRGDRSTKQRVMLVAIDAPTVEAWGPPPWRADKLFGAISRGNPTAVGIVGDARLVPGAPQNVIAGGDVSARMLAAAKLSRGEAQTNYIGQRGLPMVSAAQVASGAIPSATFANKLVIVGVTAQPYAGAVSTPVGAMTPAQEHAHSLASVVDGVGWRTTPAWLWVVSMMLVSLAAILASRRPKLPGVYGAIVIAAVVALAYALFTTHTTMLGVTSLIAAAVLAPAIERIRERRLVRGYLAELGLWTRQRRAAAQMRLDVSDEQAYWHRVATLARLYLGSASTIVAELPRGATRLELRAINGTSTKDIADRELDVRRKPFHTPHMLQTPVWIDGFMKDAGTSTLLVPLVVRRTTIGFWIINFQGKPRDHEGSSHMELVRMLALELAMAIDRRKQLVPTAQRSLLQRLAGGGRIATELLDIRQHVQWQTQHQQDLLTLGESMPFGVFVATMWGEIRYMNASMKALCTQRGLDPADTGNSLPDVLCRLTAFHSKDVHDHLRRLVQELAELHLRGRDFEGEPGHDFVLSWLEPGQGGNGEQLLLVCALPRKLTEQQVREVRPLLPLSLAPSRTPEDAMTIRRPRFDPAELVDATPVGRATQVGVGVGSSTRMFAVGTPTFVRPKTEPPFVEDPVTFVGPDDDLRKSRPLPIAEPLVDFTIPMERMEGEEA
jgi:hypothetical protein